jgi:hypothetical protein
MYRNFDIKFIKKRFQSHIKQKVIAVRISKYSKVAQEKTAK